MGFHDEDTKTRLEALEKLQKEPFVDRFVYFFPWFLGLFMFILLYFMFLYFVNIHCCKQFFPPTFWRISVGIQVALG